MPVKNKPGTQLAQEVPEPMHVAQLFVQGEQEAVIWFP